MKAYKMEKSLDFLGFPNYTINTHGNVYSKYLNKIINGTILNCGYRNVILTHNIIKKSFRNHQLVALSFIPNIHNKPCINHINGNKLDNNLENLEWVTYSENSLHAFKLGLSKPTMLGKFGKLHHNSIGIIGYTDDFDLFKIFDSTREAERKLKVDHSDISKCCKLKKSYCGKYNNKPIRWKYIV